MTAQVIGSIIISVTSVGFLYFIRVGYRAKHPAPNFTPKRLDPTNHPD